MNYSFKEGIKEGLTAFTDKSFPIIVMRGGEHVLRY